MTKTWKDRISPIVQRLQPAARVAERVAGLAVHIKTPTLIGMTGLVSAGINGLGDMFGQPKTPGTQVVPYMSRGQILEALEQGGARVTNRKFDDGRQTAECLGHNEHFWVDNDGDISISTQNLPGFLEWLRQVCDRWLPPAIEIRRRVSERVTTYEAREVALTALTNTQADKVLAATLPLLEGGRTILLDGKPGVGKTTMAEIIARDSQLGRVVKLDGALVGRSVSSSNEVMTNRSSGLRESLTLLSPGVIIVDDIDKLYLSLETIEALRRASRLVVFTANNGEFDEVLDGAVMRAGRVDEVFTIEPSDLPRAEPFDRLTDEEWAEVSQWPISYLLEVKKRLQHRHHRDLRLEDLRARVKKKTRSGEVLR